MEETYNSGLSEGLAGNEYAKLAEKIANLDRKGLKYLAAFITYMFRCVL